MLANVHHIGSGIMNPLIRTLLVCAVWATIAATASAAPAVGDTFTFRVVNAYNSEVVGQVAYRVDKSDARQVQVSVTPDRPSLGLPHTEILGADANWVRHQLINHDTPVEYDFSPPYPAFVAPLDAGKSWSVRVSATNSSSGRRNSVRVDGDVLGNERVTTPAGSFETIRVRRRAYAGDWEAFRNETNIDETEWFAPALGFAVKTERKSGYIDQQRCATRLACSPTRGDWFIYELASYSTSKPAL
jgi:hypothetical protein